MILRRILLSNFGIYGGTHEICLTPEPEKPIVLFGGKNGAGKSTLLEAVRLCFYGKHAARDLQLGNGYERYLASRIHINPAAVIQPSSASIEVEFCYAENGGIDTYRICRSWEKKNSRILETLVVQRNGCLLGDLSPEHWQDFIRDLVPIGISQLFFFDGERIQHLADDDTDQTELAESVKALLGIDIIERLQADLTIYKTKCLRSETKENPDSLNSITTQIEALHAELDSKKAERDKLSDLLDESRRELAVAEQLLAKNGGGFARNRERLLQKKTELRTRATIHEETIRHMLGGALPFLAALPLCDRLEDQLEQEEKATFAEALLSHAAKIQSEISDRLDDPKVIAKLGKVNNQARAELKRLVSAAFEEALTTSTPGVDGVHRMSEENKRQCQGWIREARLLAPQLKIIGQEIEDLYRELQQVEKDLNQIPSEESLKPYFESLAIAHAKIAKISLNYAALDDQVRTIQTEIDKREKQLAKESEVLAGKARALANIERASKVQLALEEYKQLMLERKVEQLQTAITESFTLLSRKKDTLRSIHIDPSDFSVELRDRNHRPLAKADLSAGEKQIYAVAVLWGLSKVSGKPLPMIIDTPLARLDSDHRQLLAHNYFPAASHQVIILSTDTEIDKQYLELLMPSVSRSYKLEYSNDVGTTIRSGYFWDEAH